MTKPPAPPEQPCFIDELPPGARLPDRINRSTRRPPCDTQPGESVEDALQRQHDAEFGAPTK